MSSAAVFNEGLAARALSSSCKAFGVQENDAGVMKPAVAFAFARNVGETNRGDISVGCIRIRALSAA